MIVVEAPPDRQPERHYVTDLVLRQRLGQEWASRPGAQGKTVLHLAGRRVEMPDVLLGTPDERWLQPGSLPIPPFAELVPPARLDERFVGPWLPVLFSDDRAVVDRTALDVHLFGGRDDVVTLPVDVLGTVFFLLTRYEELVLAARDGHDRFPADASVTGRADLLRRPLADEHIELLWGALKLVAPDLERAARQPRLHLTHDVDFGRFGQTASATTAARATFADVVKRRDVRLAVARATSYVAQRAGRAIRGDPYDSFEWLMDVADRNGLTSAFYFMADRPAGAIEATYDIAEPWVRRTLRAIGERGHEIGLHASYGSHDDPGQLRREFERLRAVAEESDVTQQQWGGRHHYLRWRNPTSWRSWDEAGLAYDGSVGYAERPGFRTGTSHEYTTFDLLARKPLNLRERPLVVMDTTFRQYLHSESDEARGAALALADAAATVGGDYVLLWHNSSVVGREQRRFYAELVEDLRSRLL